MPKSDFHVNAKGYFWNMDPDPEKPVLLKIWTQKNLDTEKHRPKKTRTLKTWILENME